MIQSLLNMDTSPTSGPEPLSPAIQVRRSLAARADAGSTRHSMYIVAAAVLTALLLLAVGRAARSGERIVLLVSSNEAPF